MELTFQVATRVSLVSIESQVLKSSAVLEIVTRCRAGISCNRSSRVVLLGGVTVDCITFASGDTFSPDFEESQGTAHLVAEVVEQGSELLVIFSGCPRVTKF